MYERVFERIFEKYGAGIALVSILILAATQKSTNTQIYFWVTSAPQ